LYEKTQRVEREYESKVDSLEQTIKSLQEKIYKLERTASSKKHSSTSQSTVTTAPKIVASAIVAKKVVLGAETTTSSINSKDSTTVRDDIPVKSESISNDKKVDVSNTDNAVEVKYFNKNMWIDVKQCLHLAKNNISKS
jgi:hypothetical protein